MYLLLDLKSSKTSSETISIFNGDILMNLNVSKLLSKNSNFILPISNFINNLNDLEITGIKKHKVSFTQEQQLKQESIFNKYVDLPRMSAEELRNFNFDSSKSYRVHITKDLMLESNGRNSEITDYWPSALAMLINSIPSIEEIFIDDDVDYIGHSAFADCDKIKVLKIPKSVNFIGPDSLPRNSILIIDRNSNELNSIETHINHYIETPIILKDEIIFPQQQPR